MNDPTQGPSPYRGEEVRTPALDSFLAGNKLRRMMGAESRRAFEELWREEVEHAPEELEPYRIMVLWRLVRRTAQMKGQLGDDERMEEAFEGIDPSPWTAYVQPVLTPGRAHSLARRRTMARVMLLHTEPSRANMDGTPGREGLPLLPPEEPEAAERWCDAAAIVARDLHIEDTEEGCWGLRGLLDPASAHWNAPTPEQLLSFEELVIIEATEILVSAGDRACIRHFREHYNLTRTEALQLVKLARARAFEEMSGSVEEDRALLAAYWKDYIERARKEPAGLTHEARGYKELARVLGVTRTEPEDNLAAFIKTVAAVTAEQRAKQIEAPKKQPPKQPPTPALRAADTEPTDVDFVVREDPADEEALRKYDEENA